MVNLIMVIIKNNYVFNLNFSIRNKWLIKGFI